MARNVFIILSQSHDHKVFWVDSEGEELTATQVRELASKIYDPIDQKICVAVDEFPFTGEALTLVHFNPGVTDNPAKSFKELIENDVALKNRTLEVHSGILTSKLGRGEFNPTIQSKINLSQPGDLKKIESLDFELRLEVKDLVSTYPLKNLSDQELMDLSKVNCWALSLDEMKLIQAHFAQAPTDVEIEMLAQTWSEHCKHKIFNARIEYEDADQKFVVNSLFKEFIKNPTYKMNKPWAVSLFDDNAGVVRFREGMDLCIKVETHNSPSALDPYGGALTGILGVNRDIMGTGLGAKPVANTNVFCVGMPDEDELPSNLIHPTDILAGIHRGVMDGGNKSGIPTVNGAIIFDESYSGKPLVYCGTVGIIPPTIQGLDACKKGQRPGDLVVMVGGGVGIDGIHGATASSLVMDKHTTIGMVQIGDPFSQKRMLDFLLVARDRLLYNSLTDNGAGGLSSSVGEMSAATNGAVLHLETVPLKYPGLSPWQILVSESQERMTLSVPKENWKEISELAALYQVAVTNIGEFTSDGFFTCLFNGKPVCKLELSFLHDGLPKMNLKARYHPEDLKSWKKKSTKESHALGDHLQLTKKLLSHPTIASKEKWVRQYDHEVQGATAVKPFEGLTKTAPNDAGVLWYGAYGLDGIDGFAVASGLCPQFSLDDTHLMTKLAVDESVRNLICHGADPEKMALVDNFCWPDPTVSEFKLAQLVRSCMGLKSIMETYQMPLVSGKDSMKNDYHGESVKISVLPTLLVTALGHVPDVSLAPKSHAEVGDHLYRLGFKKYDTYFGHFLHKYTDLPRNNKDSFDWERIRKLYSKMFEATSQNLLKSVHDLSEGGFVVALFETLLMNQGGIELKVEALEETGFLYSELPGHFVVSVTADNKDRFEKHFSTDEWQRLGIVDSSGTIKINKTILPMRELEAAWRQL